MTERRIVSIWFPHFAIQRWAKRCPYALADHTRPKQASPPIVLARDAAHGPVIHDVNRAAIRLGMRRGARITDMRTLVPHLRVEDAMPDADRADLTKLTRWAQRWSPWTQTDEHTHGPSDGADGLYADTTGCDHLFGGEAAMLADMRRAFAALGLTAQVACAPTPGAAWALARYGPKDSLCHSADLAGKLAPLPAAALRLDDNTLTLLRRLGLTTIGAVAGVPKTALLRRFRRAGDANANPVVRLDQAMGRLAEPLTPVKEAVPVRAVRRLVEPVITVEALTQVLRTLSEDLCALMDKQGLGARRLTFTGFRVDGLPVDIRVATSEASRDPAHLQSLFMNRFDGIDAGYGIDIAALEASVHEAFVHAQEGFERAAHDDVAFHQLIDRLVARLGPQAVHVPQEQGSHMPERACLLVSPGHAAPASPNPVRRGDATALRLLSVPERAKVLHAVPDGPPAQMIWRRVRHRIVKVKGPERIAPEWWREKSDARLRDYYHVEDAKGRRYWIFREGLVGDGRGDTPSWYVHGIDA